MVLLSNDISHHPLPQADTPYRSTMTFNDKKQVQVILEISVIEHHIAIVFIYLLKMKRVFSLENAQTHEI